MIYFHGTYQDLGDDGLQYELQYLGKSWECNVLCIEYPGYGMNFNRGITTVNEIT